MHLAFQGKKELRAEENRSLWSPIKNLGVEQRDRSIRDAKSARHALKRELVKKYLQKD